MTSSFQDDAWTEQALRLYRRYEREIVGDLNLCPWAEPSRLDGHVREHVLLQTDDVSVEPSVLALASSAHPEVEIVLLIFPRLQLGRVDFDSFAARIRDAEAAQHALGRVPFVSAVFHPYAKADCSEPERLIPLLRRTPDPTIQFVRASLLERVRERAPQGTQFVDIASFDASASGNDVTPLRERIARSNLKTVDRIGIAELTRRLDEIQRDRDISYRALATDPRER
jgi:hypothetical protein